MKIIQKAFEINGAKNIPVKRKKEMDVIIYEGSEIKRIDIAFVEIKKKHDNEINLILNDVSVKYCYIIKGGYYYRDNYCGYTESKLYAGVYTKEEAAIHAKNILSIRLIPIEITTHNEYIHNSIAEIQKHFIA